MRDLSKDRSLLAINSATVKPWTLEQLVEGCVRAGITAIAPWRDIVQAAGVDKAGLLANPELATQRMKAIMATRGIEA